MPLPDRRRNDTGERLVGAAAALFADRGYAGTTIAEIERAVGLTPGSGGLYRHFSSKEELLLAAVLAYHERVKAVRRSLGVSLASVSLDTNQAAYSQLGVIIASLIDFLSGEQAMVRIGAEARSLPIRVRHAIGAAWNEGYGIFEDLFCRGGVNDRCAKTMAIAALGSLSHYFDHISSWGHEPLDVAMEEYVEVWKLHWANVLTRPQDADLSSRDRASRESSDPTSKMVLVESEIPR
ncbi:MAG: TetR/AcrR family transcriptional regulator [Acidimicrobiales bacterium]